MTIKYLTEQVGAQLGITEWAEITQARINAFAEASGDRQWIHVDADRAATESPYGAPIAHDFLLLSMMSQLSREVLPVDDARLRLNYGVSRVRFPAAVPVGSRVRGSFRLLSIKPFEQGLDVTLAATMELRGSTKPCCAAEWVLRYYRV